MVEIRPARYSDIDNCIDLMREFCEESLSEYGFEIKIEQAQTLLRQFVESSFVVEKNGKIVGVIAGTVSVFPLDGVKIFQEVVWYVSKQYRSYGVRLLKYLENHCLLSGIKHIIMVHMSNLNAKKVGDFYKKMGFRELEVQYIKTLGG